MFSCFVVDEVHHSLVRPIVKAFVAVSAPVILIDTTWVTDDYRSYVVGNTPLDNIF
jgi:ABC-type sugar transport system substrate-binding protein